MRADQRRRLLEAVAGVVAARGYEAMSVAHIVKAAGVSRNAFYENFADKEECFAAAHDACQERLLAALEESCDRRASVEERVEAALGRAFDLLAAEPALARLIFVEAPAASEPVARRYHEWLRRYGTLLRSTVPEAAERSSLAAEMDPVIVGGLATRVASEVLDGRGAQLRQLTPHALDYVLAFYEAGRPDRAVTADSWSSEPLAPPRRTRRQASS